MIRNLWDALLAEGRKEQGWHARRIDLGSPVTLLAAIQQPSKKPALLLEVSSVSVSSVIEYPATRGFEVFPEPIIHGPNGSVRICLVLGENSYQSLFSAFAQDIADVVSQASTEKDAVHRLLARLNIWKQFMQDYGPEGLSLSAQTGLFSELCLIRELIGKAPASSIVNAWHGPDKGLHDFVWPHCSVEVKGTTVVPPESFEVGNLAQLDETLVECLLLCCVTLETTNSTNGITLPNIIEEIRLAIQNEDPSTLAILDDKLLEGGYMVSQAELYDKRLYCLREMRFYCVFETFPRIRHTDLITGIRNCSYSVSLSSCEPYRISFKNFEEMLSGVVNESRT